MEYAKLKIMEFKNWDLYLHEDQCYLGRLYLVARNQPSRCFSSLTRPEIDEFLELVTRVTTALTVLFQPDIINYTSLSNSSKHLHAHFIPRYKDKRYFERQEFVDNCWGRNYKTQTRTTLIEMNSLLGIKNGIRKQLLTG